MKLTHVLEKNVFLGERLRWLVVDCSSDITAEVVKVGIDNDVSNHANYELRVTGNELENRVIILHNPLKGTYPVFIVVKSEGQFRIRSGEELVNFPFRDHWKLERSTYLTTISPDLNYSLHVSRWGVCQLIEHGWSLQQYWVEIHRAVQYAPVPELTTENCRDGIDSCFRAISDHKQLKELGAKVDRIKEIVYSVMKIHPQEPGAIVARLAKHPDTAIAGLGNDLCQIFHDIGRLVDAQLHPDYYLQPFERPNRRRPR